MKNNTSKIIPKNIPNARDDILYFLQFLIFISLALIIINEKKSRKIADLIGKTSDNIGSATSKIKANNSFTKPPIEIDKRIIE